MKEKKEKKSIEQQKISEEQLQDVSGGVLPKGAGGDYMAQMFAASNNRTRGLAQRTGNEQLAAKANQQDQKLAGFFYGH